MTKLARTSLFLGIGVSIALTIFGFLPLELFQENKLESKKESISRVENTLDLSSSVADRYYLHRDTDSRSIVRINEIRSTELAQEEVQKQLNQRKVFTLILIILLLCIGALAIFAFRLSKKRKEIADTITKINADKDHFIGVVSHDLRSPLSSIMALSSIMVEDAKNTSAEEVQEFSSIILNSSQRMEHLINNMLDANKIETGNTKLEIKPISLKNALADIVDSIIYLAKEKEIETELFIEDNLPEILGDFNAVQRVVENLISNAYKFSPKKQLVKITATLQGTQVQVSVKDHGPGMSDLDRSKLFKKFEKLSATPTGNEKSTGLGLFIVKNLMTEMNGTILVESELGKGTTFTVLFNIA